MRVFFTNLGCKLNQSELEALARRMRADGHEIVSSLNDAELHVVNSCTVTHVAARRSRKTARLGRRASPAPRTVLTGCYVSGSPTEAAALSGVDLVVPNSEKDRLLERIYERFPHWQPKPAAAPVPVPYVPLRFGNSRALVKIEDGCNMSCSFCIIPQTRGSQTSRPADEVVDEVAALVRGGFAEVVITGVQISSYRWRGTRLYDLVKRVLDETSVQRLRLTSIAPWDFDLRLLDLVETGRVCRHFHLSLQAGSDRTLLAMRRPYTTAQFSAVADTLRRRIPDLAITTDVIVGYPSESERDFADSLSFVSSQRFAKVHAFPYSPRPGTRAAAMTPLEPSIQRRRMRRMLEIADSSRHRFLRRQLGAAVPVLWERHQGDAWQGTSDNYIKVTADSKDRLGMSATQTLLQEIVGDVVRGIPLEGNRGLSPDRSRRVHGAQASAAL